MFYARCGAFLEKEYLIHMIYQIPLKHLPKAKSLMFQSKSPCTQHHCPVYQIDPNFLVCKNHPVNPCINRINEKGIR